MKGKKKRGAGVRGERSVLTCLLVKVTWRVGFSSGSFDVRLEVDGEERRGKDGMG